MKKTIIRVAFFGITFFLNGTVLCCLKKSSSYSSFPATKKEQEKVGQQAAVVLSNRVAMIAKHLNPGNQDTLVISENNESFADYVADFPGQGYVPRP